MCVCLCFLKLYYSFWYFQINEKFLPGEIILKCSHKVHYVLNFQNHFNETKERSFWYKEGSCYTNNTIHCIYLLSCELTLSLVNCQNLQLRRLETRKNPTSSWTLIRRVWGRLLGKESPCLSLCIVSRMRE